MPVDNLKSQSIPENASQKNLAHLRLYEWAGCQLPGGWIVEMGCEMGFGLPLLYREDRMVIGLEIQFEELHFSKSKRNANLMIDHVCADVFAIPLKDACCSGICMLNVLHLLPEPTMALFECRRILKPNQPLVMAIPTDYNLPEAWRKPNAVEYFRGLLIKVFTHIELSQTDHGDETPHTLHGKKHQGWITAICH